MLALKEKLEKSLELLQKYDWLLDAYVLVGFYQVSFLFRINVSTLGLLPGRSLE